VPAQGRQVRVIVKISHRLGAEPELISQNQPFALVNQPGTVLYSSPHWPMLVRAEAKQARCWCGVSWLLCLAWNICACVPVSRLSRLVYLVWSVLLDGVKSERHLVLESTCPPARGSHEYMLPVDARLAKRSIRLQLQRSGSDWHVGVLTLFLHRLRSGSQPASMSAVGSRPAALPGWCRRYANAPVHGLTLVDAPWAGPRPPSKLVPTAGAARLRTRLAILLSAQVFRGVRPCLRLFRIV
jgi:hypothetical protein